MPVDVDGRSVGLFNVAGELFAVDDQCLHMGASLSGGRVLAGPVVECPWHRRRYDLRTGLRVDRRGSSITVHAVDVVDGSILMAVLST